MRWDGEGYHRVASVQEAWGIKLLNSIPQGDYRRILDAGCGSGRLTAHLLRMFPRCHVVALDRSEEMLARTARTLKRFSRRVELVRGDLLDEDPGRNYDLIFSNATFHWIEDHGRLFRNLHTWLASGGILLAQCGGPGNLQRIERLFPLLAEDRAFRPHLHRFRRPVHYGSQARTRDLLRRAGFSHIRVWLHQAPARFSSRDSFADFIRHVICVPNLSQLDTEDLKECYLKAFMGLYEAKFGKHYVLDYVRLNIRAQKSDQSFL